MAAPVITNRRPNEGDTDVSVSTPFRFGLRDLDTRVDLPTVYCAATYARAVFTPDADLPREDAVLEAAGVAVNLTTFNDSELGTSDPKNPCDESLETVGPDTVYRIEKGGVDGMFQEGILTLRAAAETRSQPCSFHARIDLPFVTPDAGYAYVPFADFVGVLIGLVYWPENTGVFLFFRDDGTKRISVTGPATDEAGSRTVAASVVYDWSVPTTYSIHFDPTEHSRSAAVFATDSTGTETLLAEIDLNTIEEFDPSVRVGAVNPTRRPDDEIMALVGIDATDQGNYIDVYGLELANFGRVLLARGRQTAASSADVIPVGLSEIPGDVDEWSQDTDLVVTVAEDVVLTADVGATALYRDEPELAQGEWMVIGRLRAEGGTHDGVYYTGVGVQVEDGAKQYRLSFLDDFDTVTVGVDNTLAADDAVLTGYWLPATDVDWTADVDFLLLGSTSRDILRLYLAGETTAPAVDKTYSSAGYPSTTAERVSVGFLSAGPEPGTVTLGYLWFFPHCTFYEAVDASYPDAQGWTRTSSGGTRALAAGLLEVDCAAVGAYDVYYLTDATYDPTSGAALLLHVEVLDWVDADGAVSPPRSEIGPIASIRVDDTSVQLRLVSVEGRTYAYLSSSSSDWLRVVSQDLVGSALSTEVDTTLPHVFLLDVRPGHHVRVFVDFDETPAIDIDWVNAADVLRALPAEVPAGAVVAWGSLDANAGVSVKVSYARASVGRGYDFRVNLRVTEDELQEHVYGSVSQLFIDVTDED